ncbi:MAG: AMP-binding protein, partial [Myxococcota bacterium]
LLRAYCGATDIAVATTSSNRNDEFAEPIIAFMANILVLRSDLSGEPTWAEIIERIRDGFLDSVEHEEIPFRLVGEALHRHGHPPGARLFNVMFALQVAGELGAELDELTFEPAGFELGRAKFHLYALVVDRGTRFELRLHYQTARYAAATIARLAEHYALFLAHLTGDVGQVPAWQLAWQRAPETGAPQLMSPPSAIEPHLPRDWTGTARGLADCVCVHESFAAQVDRAPDRIAVSTSESTLSFRALDIRANQLAHMLRALGVGREVCVGLYLDRSSESIIGLLGILKAGGAYVPLHPDLPCQRLDLIMRDTAAPVVVTTQRLAATWQPAGVEVVCLDDPQRRLAEQPESRPDSHSGPENLAYVLYTSGSTGRPRGVMVEHRAVHHLWEGLERAVYGTIDGDASRPLRIGL